MRKCTQISVNVIAEDYPNKKTAKENMLEKNSAMGRDSDAQRP